MKKFILLVISCLFLINAGILHSESFTLPDTGQTKCYDNSKEIPCPEPGEPFYGQDAQYQGAEPKYTVQEIDGDKVVIDDNTGIVWMQGTADTNNDGKIDGNDELDWEDAVNYCENLIYAGYDDWRLPTLFELSTIVNYGTYNPAIDKAVFECKPDFYWSSTTNASSPDDAWIISFLNGNANWLYKSDHDYVRCVRAGLLDNLDRFENLKINGDEVVKDNVTGVMWMQGTADINNDGKIDGNDKLDWEDAVNYCENLNYAGYNDWRLPNGQELRSIVNYDTDDPAIDKAVFECKPDFYWSSTTNAYYPDGAWIISFLNGNANWLYKSDHDYVRCVRAGLFDNLDRFENLKINGDEVVKDNVTGVMWMQGTADVNNDGKIDWVNDALTWKEALEYCENLNYAGYDDWKLPSEDELKTIVDTSNGHPTIDKTVFECKSAFYWSATTFADNPSSAWAIYFYYGYDYWVIKSSHYYVRCVRIGIGGSFDDCDSNHLDYCTSESECAGAGGYWENGECKSNSSGQTTGKFYLPDTGQTKCYDNSTEIPCPKPGEPFYGQDAQYQGAQPKYTVQEIDGDKVVIDDNTGIVWMQGTADTNNDGKIDGNDELDWEDAVNYCENLNYAGYDDWRLPTLFELSTIVNYGTYNPAIDKTVFECQSAVYWSATTNAYYPDGAWIINFDFGIDYWDYKSYHYYVRCVRTGLFDNLDRFENSKINGDEVVKDNVTGVMWMQGTADTNNDGKIDGDDKLDWEDAVNYCENLNYAGYNDWRLPNIQELISIVKYDAYGPAIDKTVFECKSVHYWSATTNAYYPDYAWIIGFGDGVGSWNVKSTHYYVRCVRTGIGGSFDGCDSNHLDYCTNESECAGAGGYWENGECKSNSSGQTTGKFYLPDTGQTKCYDNSSEIPCSSPGEDFYGQDANYQGLEQKFTVKEISGDKVVIDDNTGIVWMQGTADTNNDGKIDSNDELDWEDAVNYCENLNYAGYDDWRLPTLFELSTIVNYGTYNPAIDKTVFECKPDFYWSSTTNASSPDDAWIISFLNGNANWLYKSDHDYVRCVRAGLFDNLDRFENSKINGDEVVKDNVTGLMWMKKTSDINNDGQVDLDNDTLTWDEALKYCENLNYAGYNDWRLPNGQELRSIVNYDTYIPAIDGTMFECQSAYYWSATTTAGGPGNAWVIHFFSGYDYWDSKSSHHYVRCVRTGIGGSFDDCDSNHLDYCTSESECEGVGGYWDNNKCVSMPTGETGIIKIKSGWNLKALPVDVEVGVDTGKFEQTEISTLWKWNGSGWEIWSPKSTIMDLILKYDITKAEKVNAGEGFWINASGDAEINVGSGEEYGLEKVVVNNGWNLVGVGKDADINEFNKLESIKTVWKWSGSSWQIWSPDTNIMNLISNYGLTSIEKIDKGEGFWVNK